MNVELSVDLTHLLRIVEDQSDKGAKKQSMMEPEDEGDDPDGDIDGADAWLGFTG